MSIRVTFLSRRLPAFAVLLAVLAVVGFVSVARSECVPAPRGIVGWWPFDDPLTWPCAEPAPVPCSYVQELAYEMPAWRYGNVQSIPGVVGNAFRMTNASAGSIRVWSAPQYYLGTGSFSIDAWIRPFSSNSAFQHLQPIVDGHWGNVGLGVYETGTGYSLYLKHGDPTLLMSNGDGTVSVFSAGLPLPLPLETWVHLAVTVQRDGGDGAGAFYVNGVLVQTFIPSMADMPLDWLTIGQGPANFAPNNTGCANT